jgi:hypothetical protein
MPLHLSASDKKEHIQDMCAIDFQTARIIELDEFACPQTLFLIDAAQMLIRGTVATLKIHHHRTAPLAADVQQPVKFLQRCGRRLFQPDHGYLFFKAGQGLRKMQRGRGGDADDVGRLMRKQVRQGGVHRHREGFLEGAPVSLMWGTATDEKRTAMAYISAGV